MSQQLKNQQSIQILRANENYDPNISETILLYGQPFYSKKNQQLYVGINEHIKNTSPIGAANIKPSALINNNKEPGEKNFSAESMRALNTSKNYQGANGVDSFAFGRDLTAGGEQSVSFGASNISNNNQTFVSGQTNKVLGEQSFGTGDNVEVYSDQGFVANSKNINLGIKSAVFGENNFVGGSKSLVSGNWNTESYFALDIVNKKLYKSWSNPLNTSSNILSSSISEVVMGAAQQISESPMDQSSPIYTTLGIESLPSGITGSIEGGYPDSDLTKVTFTNNNIQWTKDEDIYYATIETNESETFRLSYYSTSKDLEIDCGRFFAGITYVDIDLSSPAAVNITGTINDRVIGTFKIDSTTYYLGYDYYDNLLVGTGTKTIKDKDGNDKVVVRPEKARCYKWKNNSNVLLFSLELDDYIPFNNIISGKSNKIRFGSNNILSGNVNDIISGSNNLVSGAYNDINGNYNIIVGANNEFLIDGGEASAALGLGLQINRTNQTVIGKYNQPSKTDLFIVAGGSKDNRQNFFTISQNGATVVPKIPTSPHEVLRYSDFISTNGKLSTENGFDVSFNTTTASKFINKITGEDLIEKIKELENKKVDSVSLADIQKQINELHDEWVHYTNPNSGTQKELIFHQEGVYFSQPTRIRINLAYTSIEVAWGEVLRHPELGDYENGIFTGYPYTYEYGEYTKDADGKTGNYVRVVAPESAPFHCYETFCEGISFLTAIRYEKSINERLTDLSEVVSAKADTKTTNPKVYRWVDYDVAYEFPGSARGFAGVCNNGKPTKVKGDITIVDPKSYNSKTDSFDITLHYTFEQEGFDDITFDDGRTLSFIEYTEFVDGNEFGRGISLYIKSNKDEENGKIYVAADATTDPEYVLGWIDQFWFEGTVSFNSRVVKTAGSAIEEIDTKVGDHESRIIELETSGGSGGNTTVDSELDNASENPVQNKVINSELTKIKNFEHPKIVAGSDYPNFIGETTSEDWKLTFYKYTSWVWKDARAEIMEDSVDINLNLGFTTSAVAIFAKISKETVYLTNNDFSVFAVTSIPNIDTSIYRLIGIVRLPKYNVSRIPHLDMGGVPFRWKGVIVENIEVENKIGDIEAALDAIIKIQNDLILNKEVEYTADAIIQLQQNLIKGGNE